MFRRIPEKIDISKSRRSSSSFDESFISEPVSPVSAYSETGITALEVMALERNRQGSILMQGFKEKVKKGITRVYKDIREPLAILPSANMHQILDSKSCNVSKSSTKPRPRRASTSDELYSRLKGANRTGRVFFGKKAKEVKEEDPLSWKEFFQPSRESWDFGLKIDNCSDGAKRVECFYEDKDIRSKLKGMISTASFDQIVEKGYISSRGAKLDTIRVCLTPKNVKNIDSIEL